MGVEGESLRHAVVSNNGALIGTNVTHVAFADPDPRQKNGGRNLGDSDYVSAQTLASPHLSRPVALNHISSPVAVTVTPVPQYCYTQKSLPGILSAAKVKIDWDAGSEFHSAHTSSFCPTTFTYTSCLFMSSIYSSHMP